MFDSLPLERLADRLVIAQLVAARRDRLRVVRVRDGLLINEFGEKQWDGRSLPSVPYAVYLARDGKYRTLAFDLDAHHRGDPGTDAAVLGQLLTASGIAYVEADSGPTGGRHLIAVFPDGLPADRVRALARRLRSSLTPSLDPSPLTNPRTGALRPPGSPHRAGGHSVLRTPLANARRILAVGNPAVAFDALCEAAGVPMKAVTSQRRPASRRRRPLSERTLTLERYGDVLGDYPDRSSVAAAVCLGYVNAGWTREEFVAAALDYRRKGLHHLRYPRAGRTGRGRRHRAAIIAAAERMWRGRVAYAEQNPAVGPSAVSTEVAEVLAAMDACPRRWGGQAGPSDHAVLSAVLATALHCRQPVVGCAVRVLSEQSGITRSAVGRALHRLTRDGWLISVATAEGAHAATYRISVPASNEQFSAGHVAGGTLDPAPLPGLRLQTGMAIKTHDVMSHGGLGRYGATVFTALTDAPTVVPDIASRTGLTRRTVRHHLQRLAASGLASHEPLGWRVRAEGRLDEAARVLGVNGTVRRRAENHEVERQTYQWYLADFAARHGWTFEQGLMQPGYHSLLTPDRRPAPSMPYPRRQGRASFTAAFSLMSAGLGPAPSSVARTLAAMTAAPSPAYPTQQVRCPSAQIVADVAAK